MINIWIYPAERATGYIVVALNLKLLPPKTTRKQLSMIIFIKEKDVNEQNIRNCHFIFACSNLAVNTLKVSKKRLSKYEEALQ